MDSDLSCSWLIIISAVFLNMFACCCPKEEEHEHQPPSQIRQPLLPQPQQAPINNHPSPLKLIPPNSNLQLMDQIAANPPSEPIEKPQNPPLSPKGLNKSSLRIGSFQQPEPIKKSSDLWDQESGTKILYHCNVRDEEMVFAFKVSKIRITQDNPVSYALHPHRQPKQRFKSSELSLCLVVLAKPLSQLRPIARSVTAQGNVRVVFGLARQEQLKLPKGHFQNEDIQQILVLGSNCLRLEAFDRIVVSALSERDFSSALVLCQRCTQFFELEDLAKVVFLLPPQLTLSEVNCLLSRLMRKFLISEKLEKILGFLSYHIELLEGQDISKAILVRSSLLQSDPEQAYSRTFQTRLQLAIGLLLVQIDYNNFKSYRKVMETFYSDMSILKYLKFAHYLHREKKEFIGRLEQFKLFEPQQLLEIQNSTRIEERQVSTNEKCILIKHRSKRKMGQLFAEYKNLQTPVEQSQKKKRQWDDDLKANDIHVTVPDKKEEEKEDYNQNIFEDLDDKDVENANLNIIADLDPLDFEEDD